jgi:integrase
MYQAYISFVRSRGRGPKTLEKYTYVLTAFIEFAKARKRSRPEAIGPADFWAFSEQMRMTDKLHRKTTRDRLIIVKQMFKWAITKARPKMLRENPIENEDVPDTESSIQPCFDPDQVEMLLKMADKHHAPIYAVMAYLGLRFGEVRDLMWSDFDFNSGHFGWVTISKGGSVEDQTKGKNVRRIPVSGKLRKFLDDLPRHEDGLLFHQQPSSHYPKGDRPLSERRLLTSLKRLCKRAKFYSPQQYKLHTFRHAFASMLARSHIAYKQALAWMNGGCSSVQTRFSASLPN